MYYAGFWVAWLLVVLAELKGNPHHGPLFVAETVYLVAFLLPSTALLTHRALRERDRKRIESPAFAVQLEEQRRAR